MGASEVLSRPLRTRERAALDAARSALRKIAVIQAETATAAIARSMAEKALERMAVLLGERE